MGFTSEWKDQMISFDGTSVTYDEIGNVISYDGYTYDWEKGRQLSSISGNNLNVSYDYNSSGLRTKKVVGEKTTEYYYSGDLLVAQYDGTYWMRFSYSPSGEPIGFALYGDDTDDYYYYTQYYYFVKNIQGDIIGLYDSISNVYRKYSYDAWGKVTGVTDLSGNEITDPEDIGYRNPLRYRGYYYDTETGLYYLNSRYYNPEWGRFVCADDVVSGTGEAVNGYNLYSYCFNNPVNLDDQGGNWPKWVSGAVNIVGGIAQMAAGAALGSFTSWTGVGAVAAGFLFVNGAATVTQGAGQIVNSFTKSNVMREDNIARTGAQSIGGAIGGESGKKIAGAAYDTAVIAANIYAGSSLKTPSACFVAGTAILAELGRKPIEEIDVGDLVWAHDIETGRKSLKKVVQTFVRESVELVCIYIDGEEIVTTPEHPFYIPQKGWVSAIQLKAGDILVLHNGNYIVVEKIQHKVLENPVRVYNFEVEDFHTYYVGQSAVLVHNTCKGKVTSPNQMQKQVLKGQAPITVIRVDNPKIPGQLPHIHFSDGTSMNIDGSVHDAMNGVHSLTNSEQIWLFKNGWGG